MEGIYSITFRGAADWGLGMLLLRSGRVTGADVAGVRYDGSYSERDGALFIDASLTVPPGVMLVQGGAAKSQPYKVPFAAAIPVEAIEQGKPVLVAMPPGPVNVIVKRLRGLED